MKPIEDAVINEFEQLVSNIAHMNNLVARMNTTDVEQLVDKLRRLEQKMSLVFTLFKASIYSLTESQTEAAAMLQHQQQQLQGQGQQQGQICGYEPAKVWVMRAEGGIVLL
ncbi:DASH complex subunit Dad3-domain-containing protein [Jimgerdemannia flammicorona]|uniref:DASH complex subunit DAD3 n=1 Tax=Jimgerdemannia flammicorona TaxID=994334 RepID=A0A433QKQ4_9FUNG|nr:DASH complex subunit Dad3-domain-containing protein [Jimgerdemannia flammicorona]